MVDYRPFGVNNYVTDDCHCWLDYHHLHNWNYLYFSINVVCYSLSVLSISITVKTSNGKLLIFSSEVYMSNLSFVYSSWAHEMIRIDLLCTLSLL